MGKNDVKYLFRFTYRKIGEYVFVLTEFSNALPHKDNCDVRLLEICRYDG